METDARPAHGKELIKAAAALRVKYKRPGTHMMPLMCMGVSQSNRCGIYPEQGRLVGLMKNIFFQGFSLETINHAGVCVEEIPASEQPQGYETIHDWNVKCSSRHPMLKSFVKGSDRITHGTLSRSHGMFICKMIKNQAEWPWPENLHSAIMSKHAVDMIALADLDGDLAEVLRSGIKMEVLSYAIILEDKEALSLISQALNLGNDIALATAESTAIAMLSDTVSFALKNAKVSNQGARTLAFNKIKETVSVELANYASLPNFQDVFEFVMEMGANEAPFIRDLTDYLSVWVNSSKKRLPLAAFKEVNKIVNKFPRAKLAIIKRAYCLTPNKDGFCPPPEGLWGRVKHEEMEKLETLLKYWDRTLADIINRMNAYDAQKLRANVFVNAAAAFIKSVGIQGVKVGDGDVQRAMLVCTLEDYAVVSEHAKKHGIIVPPPECVGADDTWIDYAEVKKQVDDEKKKEAEKAAALAAALADGESKKKILPVCILYDELGNPLTQQETHDPKKKPAKLELPVKAWLDSPVGKELSTEKADMAAITFAMHAIHQSDALPSLPLRYELDPTTSRISVFATQAIEKGTLKIPVDTPSMTAKLGKDPEKSGGVKIVVTEYVHKMSKERKKRMCAKTPQDIRTREATYFAYIDQKLCSWEQKIDTANACVANRVHRPFDGKESMNPFWMITRMTERDMKAHNAISENSRSCMFFNCTLDTVSQTISNIGVVGTAKTSMIWDVTFPVITNDTDLKKGDKLCMQIVAKQREKEKTTWKRDAKTAVDDASDGNKKQKTDKIGGGEVVVRL